MAQNQQQQTTTEERDEDLQQQGQESQEVPPESGAPEEAETPVEELTDEELFASLDEEDEPEDPETDESGDEDREEEPEQPEGGEPEGEPAASEQEPEAGDAGQGDEGRQPEKPERPPAEQNQEPQWFQDLPEDGKKHFQQMNDYSHKLYQSYNAVLGRLAPTQRENEDLRKQLQQIEQAPPPTLDDLEKNDAYREIADEFPEEAKSLKDFFASKQREIDQVKQQAADIHQALESDRKERIARETSRLEKKHPDWAQTFHSQPFQQWKNTILAQPQVWPDMAQKLQSPWSEDNVEVLDQFQRDYAEVTGQPLPGQQEPSGGQNREPEQQAQSGGQTAQSGQTRQKPQRPRPPKPSPPSQGSGITGNRGGGTPLSDEELFARMVDRGE